MTDDRIAEIRARAEKATAGPWAVEETHGRDCVWLDVVNVATEDEIFNGETQPQEHIVCVDYGERLKSGKEHEIANLEFVAHARTDIPDLLARIAELEGELATIRLQGIPTRQHSDEAWRRRVHVLEAQLVEAKLPCYCCRDGGCSDGCKCDTPHEAI